MIQIINLLFQVYTLLIFARILGSWIPEWQSSRAMQFLAFYTDPYLNIFRKIIPPFGGIDFSPIVAFFSLNIIRYLLIGLVAKFLV